MGKVLIFTSAYYIRPLMTRQCILSSLNQSYKDFVHSVNITLDDTAFTTDYKCIYDDILNDRIIINYSKNEHIHINNMFAIKSVPNYLDYDIFIKMDNDDIYRSKYVENIVNFFKNNKDIDITSTKITNKLNGYDIEVNSFDNLGGNPENTDYNMPMTFAFTRKALDVIINLTKLDLQHDDMIWRNAWFAAGLKHKSVLNDNEIVWNIHGGNVSTGDFLSPPKVKIKTSSMSYDINKYFDRIVCINLNRAVERWTKCTAQFNKYRIRAQRFSAIEPVEENNNIHKGEIGIIRSNYEIIKRAKNDNLKSVLIFEDDFELVDDFITKFKEQISQVPDDWDFIYFGAMHISELISVSKNISKMNRSFLSHTFAVKNTMFDIILETIKNESQPLDVYYADMMPNCNAYCVIPHLSNQYNGYSYIQNRNLNFDKFR